MDAVSLANVLGISEKIVVDSSAHHGAHFISSGMVKLSVTSLLMKKAGSVCSSQALRSWLGVVK